MEKRSRTQITIETDRVFVLSRRKSPPQSWCLDCLPPSRMAVPEAVADASGLTSRAIYRAVETGKVHFTETPEGQILICLNSLSLPGDKPPQSDNQANRLTIVPAFEFESGPVLEQILADPPQARIPLHDCETVAGVVGENSSTQGLGHRRNVWALTKEAFDQLLACLDDDRERAGHKYENTRRKLMKYFECRGCFSPEDLADETMNRVARRVSEGSEIWTTDPASYFYGVARYVLMEYWHSPGRDTLPLECLPPIAHPAQLPQSFDATQPERSAESGLQALDHCVRALPAEDHEILLQYYKGEKSDKIRNRQNIANRLGIPLNALRIKVHRLRRRLEADVNEYLQRHE